MKVALALADGAARAAGDRRVRRGRVDRERARRRRGVLQPAASVARTRNVWAPSASQRAARERRGAGRERRGVDAALERRAGLARRERERRRRCRWSARSARR